MRRGMKYIIEFTPPLNDGQFFGPFGSRFGAKDWAARKLAQSSRDREPDDIVEWNLRIVFQPTPMLDDNSIGDY